jgi:hypothetical protein
VATDQLTGEDSAAKEGNPAAGGVWLRSQTLVCRWHRATFGFKHAAQGVARAVLGVARAVLGVARANTAVGVSPETFLLLLLQGASLWHLEVLPITQI